MESSSSRGSVPYYLKDPSQILPDPAHNVFASVETMFADSSIINFSLSRSGCSQVEFEFKFFRDENISPESVVLEGRASVNYTCLLSTPWAPNVNILMMKPGEAEFGKTFVIAPGAFSGVFLGSQYEGRIQPYVRCFCCAHSNILDKNEKLLYTTESLSCQCSFTECLHSCFCLRPLYDIRLFTMYTGDEARQPAFSLWQKSSCGILFPCQGFTGCCSGVCIKFCPHTFYFKIEKNGSNFPGGMLYILQSALYAAISSKL